MHCRLLARHHWPFGSTMWIKPSFSINKPLHSAGVSRLPKDVSRVRHIVSAPKQPLATSISGKTEAIRRLSRIG